MNARYYLVIDVEANCCDDSAFPRREMEIIEIGAVMADARTLAKVDQFGTFVRPVRHPRLTPFCTGLTSIAQRDVDDAPKFPAAIEKLTSWAKRYPEFLFCSWGDYDRKQFQQDCTYHKVAYPFSGHLNLKKEFSKAQSTTRRFGMAAALNHVGLPLKGTHHRGLDDAINITRLLPFALARS